jgi:hypothetical protein
LVDALAYRELAARLWSDGQIAGLYQMPLYPLLIAIVGPSIGQLGADIALSVGFGVARICTCRSAVFRPIRAHIRDGSGRLLSAFDFFLGRRPF